MATTRKKAVAKKVRVGKTVARKATAAKKAAAKAAGRKYLRLPKIASKPGGTLPFPFVSLEHGSSTTKTKKVRVPGGKPESAKLLRDVARIYLDYL